MKLLGRAKKVEAAMAAGRVDPRPLALVWTSDDSRVGEDVELQAGQHVATDVYLIEEATDTYPARYRTVERITARAGDFGDLYGADGRIAGRVLRAERPYLELEWFDDGE